VKANYWGNLISGESTEEPTITWPDSFETVLSTDDPGLNITEVLYFVIMIMTNNLSIERVPKQG
jgi:hypothetical protein